MKSRNYWIDKPRAANRRFDGSLPEPPALAFT